MIKAKVYNREGKEVGEKELNPAIFGVEMKEEVVHQAVVAQNANKRLVLAHTKDRSEVRGGGKKPWRQKGTGRARHGSIRSPIWKGGGITFGPTKDRNFQQKINKKARRKALFMCLSDKASEKGVVVLDKMEFPEIRTKEMAAMLKNLPIKGESVLIAMDKNDQNIVKSVSNVPGARAIMADSLNVVDVIGKKYFLVTEDGLKKMEETYLK